MDLFAPPNVSGWQDGPAWITAGRLLDRGRILQRLVAACPQDPEGATGAPRLLSNGTDGVLYICEATKEGD